MFNSTSTQIPPVITSVLVRLSLPTLSVEIRGYLWHQRLFPLQAYGRNTEERVSSADENYLFALWML